MYEHEEAELGYAVLPDSETKFLGIRQGSNDSIIRFTKLERGDIRLGMLEDGRLIGGGVRKSL